MEKTGGMTGWSVDRPVSMGSIPDYADSVCPVCVPECRSAPCRRHGKARDGCFGWNGDLPRLVPSVRLSFPTSSSGGCEVFWQGGAGHQPAHRGVYGLCAVESTGSGNGFSPPFRWLTRALFWGMALFYLVPMHPSSSVYAHYFMLLGGTVMIRSLDSGRLRLLFGSGIAAGFCLRLSTGMRVCRVPCRGNETVS